LQCVYLPRWAVSFEKVILTTLHVLTHVLYIWKYALLCPTIIFFLLSDDSWGDKECHKPFTRTTLRPFMPPANIWFKYGPLYLQRKIIYSLLITTFVGGLFLRGQLGVEDGVRVRSEQRNFVYVRYCVDSSFLKEHCIAFLWLYKLPISKNKLCGAKMRHNISTLPQCVETNGNTI